MSAARDTRDPPFAGLTIAAARRALAQRLRAGTHPIDTPDLDARILVGEACALDLTGLARHAEHILTAGESGTIESFALRRLAGEPVARILGRKEFWGLNFQINPDVLVPRPDTETIVAAALACVAERRTARLRIADLGTGSGAILLALLSELPQAEGIGTDISAAALACARTNAEALNLSCRARFSHGSFTDPLDGLFDLVVSNPPYIRSEDIASLDRDVRAYDPRVALDGGTDGLDPYRTIATTVLKHLSPGGWIVVETGWDQTAAVAKLLGEAHLIVKPAPLIDLGGRPRGVQAQHMA